MAQSPLQSNQLIGFSCVPEHWKSWKTQCLSTEFCGTYKNKHRTTKNNSLTTNIPTKNPSEINRTIKDINKTIKQHQKDIKTQQQKNEETFKISWKCQSVGSVCKVCTWPGPFLGCEVALDVSRKQVVSVNPISGRWDEQPHPTIFCHFWRVFVGCSLSPVLVGLVLSCLDP